MNFEKLLSKMQELRDLQGAIGLLTWDQETFLPKKAHEARSFQLATLQSLYHEKLTDEALGQALESFAEDTKLSQDEAAMVRVLRRERDRAVKIPQALVRELAQAQSLGVSAWKEARETQNFRHFEQPLLRLLRLRQEQADILGHGGNRYDALLDNFEPGMTVKRLGPVLEKLKTRLIPMVGPLAEASAKVADVFAGKTFEANAQWKVTLQVLKDMGFDFDAGRQDKSIHPFTGGTHALDVRLTTRLSPMTPAPALYGSLHEGGHGLYEQGFLSVHHRTPLAAAPSMGLHESQSRLWENMVGRSRAFVSHYLPLLRKEFPTQFREVSVEEFYAAINRVERSFIRVEADEVTYNLHIVLRYELELALLSNDLPVADLPSAWNEKMKALLGIVPKDDVMGVLQDIHWAWGELGYFPTYALGNLYAATLYKKATSVLPNLPVLISQGQLLPLRDFLRTHIHQQGYRYETEDLVQKTCGVGLNDDDFIQYLHEKYGELFSA